MTESPPRRSGARDPRAGPPTTTRSCGSCVELGQDSLDRDLRLTDRRSGPRPRARAASRRRGRGARARAAAAARSRRDVEQCHVGAEAPREPAAGADVRPCPARRRRCRSGCCCGGSGCAADEEDRRRRVCRAAPRRGRPRGAFQRTDACGLAEHEEVVRRFRLLEQRSARRRRRCARGPSPGRGRPPRARRPSVSPQRVLSARPERTPSTVATPSRPRRRGREIASAGVGGLARSRRRAAAASAVGGCASARARPRAAAPSGRPSAGTAASIRSASSPYGSGGESWRVFRGAGRRTRTRRDEPAKVSSMQLAAPERRGARRRLARGERDLLGAEEHADAVALVVRNVGGIGSVSGPSSTRSSRHRPTRIVPRAEERRGEERARARVEILGRADLEQASRAR